MFLMLNLPSVFQKCEFLENEFGFYGQFFVCNPIEKFSISMELFLITIDLNGGGEKMLQVALFTFSGPTL